MTSWSPRRQAAIASGSIFESAETFWVARARLARESEPRHQPQQDDREHRQKRDPNAEPHGELVDGLLLADPRSLEHRTSLTCCVEGDPDCFADTEHSTEEIAYVGHGVLEAIARLCHLLTEYGELVDQSVHADPEPHPEGHHGEGEQVAEDLAGPARAIVGVQPHDFMPIADTTRTLIDPLFGARQRDKGAGV